MSYVEQSSADILNYIIAFSKQEVTEEIRNAAFEAIKTFDDYNKLFDNMICVFEESFLSKRLTPEEFDSYFDYLKAEYVMLCFNNYIDIKYLENMLLLRFKLPNLYIFDAAIIWEKMDLTIEALTTCDDDRLKQELYYLCVLIINKYNITKYNLESTAIILDGCKDIDFDNFHIQKLPFAMFAM